MLNTTTIFKLYFVRKYSAKETDKRRTVQGRVLLSTALAFVIFTVSPIEMAAAQSVPIELGNPKIIKGRMTTKRVAKNKTSLSEKVAKVAYLGRAPYICTPSGFGRMSKCFAR